MQKTIYMIGQGLQLLDKLGKTALCVGSGAVLLKLLSRRIKNAKQ